MAEVEAIAQEAAPGDQSRRVWLNLGLLLLWVGVGAAFVPWTVAVAVPAVVLVHELGHLGAAHLLGLSNPRMYIAPPFGAAVIIELEPQDDFGFSSRVALFALAGPLFGVAVGLMVAAVACFAVEPMVWLALGSDSAALRAEYPASSVVALAYEFSELSLLINVVNALPIWPLDGAQLLRALFVAGRPRLDFICASVSSLCCVSFFAVDAWLGLVFLPAALASAMIAASTWRQARSGDRRREDGALGTTSEARVARRLCPSVPWRLLTGGSWVWVGAVAGGMVHLVLSLVLWVLLW